MKPNEHFTMSEPQPMGVGAKYAFWLTTDEPILVEFVRNLPCVVHVSIGDDPETSVNPEALPEIPLRVLVTIKDEFDADEAWHWIYSELDEEAQFVRLDPFWEDAIRGVL